MSSIGAAQAPERFRDLNALDVRVATIANTLAFADARLCPDRTYRPNFIVQDLALYGKKERAEAAKALGLGAYPVVTAVLGEGDRPVSEKLFPGDVIEEAGGVPLGPSDPKRPYARMAAIESVIERGLVTLTIRRGGARQVIQWRGRLGCPSRVQVVPGRSLNAHTDGTYVQLTDALARQATDEDELAFIIAHEMAHVILQHAERSGPERSEEIEADRLALKLMQAARYDPKAAARFWARFGVATDYGIFSDHSHMRAKARVAFLAAEAAKIAQ